jgi:hypothetical protein
MGLRRTPICAAFLYAFWEPFIAWGIIAALLLWFRGPPQSAFSHLGVARATRLCCLHHSSAGAGRNFSSAPSVGGACIATWLLADPLVRLSWESKWKRVWHTD